MSILATRTIEYSCRPWAHVDISDDAAIGRLLDALEADERAIGVGGVAIEEDGRVSSTFQVEAAAGDPRRTGTAARIATEIFDEALAAAGLEQRTAGLAIVEGDDPDLLP